MPPPAKRQKVDRPAEILFDFNARSDYLTGFHKRKQAKIKAAQEKAKLRDRELLIVRRKELRDQRKLDLEEHVNAVNAQIASANGLPEGENSDEEGVEWGGIPDEPVEVIDHEDEYVDEDRYTTVTVEAVDISRDGFESIKGTREDQPDEEVEDADEIKKSVNGDKKDKPTQGAKNVDDKGKKRVWTKENPAAKGKKKKKVKFRYETKSERKVTRFKERKKGKSMADARKEK